jgi:hypothetical protein
MTKNEFYDRIFKEFTNVEIILMNPNIYLNPRYDEYYMDFNAHRYRKCYEFLKSHRNMLSIEHTPKPLREAMMLELKRSGN